MRLAEPDSAELRELTQRLAVEILECDRQLMRLDKDEFLPRYNRLLLVFHNHSDAVPKRVFITVHRDGSRIGPENYYTIPLCLPELQPHTSCRYAVLAFDSFNLPFTAVRTNLTTPEEYAGRRLATKYIERAHRLATFMGPG